MNESNLSVVSRKEDAAKSDNYEALAAAFKKLAPYHPIGVAQRIHADNAARASAITSKALPDSDFASGGSYL